MIGLALEGGGVRGSYQAGVYMAMYECGVKIDGVCGTSIGAINGAVIASGKGSSLPKIWRSLSMGHVFGFSDDFVNKLLKKEVNIDFVKLTLANALKIFSNKGIELNGLCTVRFKDLKPLYLFKEDMNPDKVKDYILASCFLPFFKKEKLIDNNYYLDGGFYDLGPVNMLLNKGYDKIYLVKVHGVGITRDYPKDANVVVIESKRKLGKVIDLNPSRVDENIKMGYYDTIRILKNYDGEKYVFKRRKDEYYKFLNRNVRDKLYQRVKRFLRTDTYKETTIKAIEYIMEEEKINYYKIYKIESIIRKIKKECSDNNFIYRYVKKL